VNAIVKNVMSTHVIAVRQDATFKEMASRLRQQRVSAFPVPGIVSRVDVLSVFGRPDADIRHEITQDLILGTYLCNPAHFTVTVKDGIVTIEGAPETTAVGRDIIESARHVESVVAVRDRLTYPHP
jgi:osmotically-inducible protein OsmY